MSRFKGREAEALAEALQMLAKATGKTVGQVEAVIDEVVTPTLTLEDIDKRNYTYCSYHDSAVGNPKFLVPSVYKEPALGMARNYLLGLGIKMHYNKMHLYPKNYVVEARQLFAQGLFYKTE